MAGKQTKTLDVIAAAKGREVVVAGEVAELRFPKGASLSLLASKLLVQILDIAGAKVCDQTEHRTPVADLNWSHRDAQEIEDTIRELQRTIVELQITTSRGKARKSGPILADVTRDEDMKHGELVWEFSKTFRQVVKNSKHWAAISARAVLAMECKYSPWLYQLAALHAGRREAFRDWSLAELRERLGATAPALKRWPDFRRRVLEPAIAEVNHLTGIRVDWEPVKRGRAVIGVRLAVSRKAPEDLDEAAAELARPKVGRSARRLGLVEQIEAENTAMRRILADSLEQTWANAPADPAIPVPERHDPGRSN